MLNQNLPPLISVVMPVHNGCATLDRALRSVVGQTFRDWEIVAVDDASGDDSAGILHEWAAKDHRIRFFRFDENRGASAARNAAIENAHGRLVCYLDRDDEYYPEYLANVARHQDQAGVLVFGYDVVYEDGPAAGRAPSWDPGSVRRTFFSQHVVAPLGVAHRRELWQQAGGFNEAAWRDEDSDLWRRMARAGAEFAFLPLKSGRYHVRAESASRKPHLTRRQREMILENWRNGRPIYEIPNHGLQIANCKSEISNLKSQDGPHPNPLPEGEGTKMPHPGVLAEGKGMRKVAFVSPHCVLDFTNGAATATLDGLALLARTGFQCHAFCNSRLDSWEEVLVQEILAQRGVPYEVRNAQIGRYHGRLIFTSHAGVAITLFNSASTRGGWMNRDEIAAFLTGCEIFLKKNRPDVVWTYGGDPVSLPVQRLVKSLDIPIVFGLHNFAYRDAEAFRMVDYVIVPTEFCREFYWNAIGLASLMLPLVVDPARVAVNVSGTGYPLAGRVPIDSGTRPASGYPVPDTMSVTFVNPEPRKGVHVFARIAEVLSRKRPDIPLLLVEGASKLSSLPQLGVDLSGLKNLKVLPNSPDARGFHAMTKMLVMPSLMENAGLVAIEAMLNGTPVLASTRGGLPETVGDAGLLLDIPARYTPETRDVPTAEEVEPWVEAIIRLWDDPAEHERWSRAARKRAERWRPERLATLYREFFSQITHQPGPPLVPKEIANSRLIP